MYSKCCSLIIHCKMFPAPLWDSRSSVRNQLQLQHKHRVKRKMMGVDGWWISMNMPQYDANGVFWSQTYESLGTSSWTTSAYLSKCWMPNTETIENQWPSAVQWIFTRAKHSPSPIDSEEGQPSFDNMNPDVIWSWHLNCRQRFRYILDWQLGEMRPRNPCTIGFPYLQAACLGSTMVLNLLLNSLLKRHMATNFKRRTEPMAQHR